MQRWIIAAVLGFVVAVPAHAQGGDPKEKTVVDLWDAVYLEGGKAGFWHTTVVEFERDGQKILRTTNDMQLLIKRFNSTILLEVQNGTDETAKGDVTGTFMRQVLGPNKETIIVGLVKGKQLELSLDGKAGVLKPAPWDPGVLGLYRQQALFADKKVKPGDKFSFATFEPQVNLVVRMDVVVKEQEEIELLAKKKAKLLRVEMTPEKLEGVQLPVLVIWLDDEWKPLRQDSEIPGLGKMTLYRTNKDIAMAPSAEATLTDIGFTQLIRLNQAILRPYDSSTVLYRITVKGDEDAAKAFSQDDRQKVLKAKGQTFEMQIQAIKNPVKKAVGVQPGAEFTQSSYFITSDDARVKDHARKAVGKEKDPWKKALAIEKYVNKVMRVTNVEVMAPADHVAKTLEGDCTEFAMLMAAMCRAEGIPSKTAIGLLYADTKTGPVMAFHMWTEVFVQGQWIPLDATLGRGYVGASHLKVTDHSWHDTRALTPLLPLTRVLGKMQVEILTAK
ncbi:MAG TPA: transglutaminase-like domain-containing protein [Gemmataceae bacterium]|nr:transglutaminase-like domain-containing protein [Gemmataceae bacterium]